MLDSFLAEKAEEERLFRELEGQTLQGEVDHSVRELEVDGKRGISVDEFRTAFAEDWQLSQFW
jgi:EEF1A lysine methyltransferase 1